MFPPSGRWSHSAPTSHTTQTASALPSPRGRHYYTPDPWLVQYPLQSLADHSFGECRLLPPTRNTPPAAPMLSTLPVLPMLSTLPVLPMLRMLPTLPMLGRLPALPRLTMLAKLSSPPTHNALPRLQRLTQLYPFAFARVTDRSITPPPPFRALCPNNSVAASSQRPAHDPQAAPTAFVAAPPHGARSRARCARHPPRPPRPHPTAPPRHAHHTPCPPMLY